VTPSRADARLVAAPAEAGVVAEAGRRRVLLTVVAMVAISLSLGALFGNRGLLDLLRYKRERERLVADIAELEAEVSTLEAEIRALDGEPAAVERIAREELSLGEPGEALIFLGPGPLAAPPGAPNALTLTAAPPPAARSLPPAP